MTEASDRPVPYRVVYSEQVRRSVRALVTSAAARGRGPQALAAVKAIDARLQIYPQFGEPLRDLAAEGEVLWIGSVPPLVVQYVIDETHHVVIVVKPLQPLSGSGF